uniref:Uncharacterized protein n=1 Tax=Anguilla anguilla TaxID=7936 RepID=A0A0E9W890_ANGAN
MMLSIVPLENEKQKKKYIVFKQIILSSTFHTLMLFKIFPKIKLRFFWFSREKALL